MASPWDSLRPAQLSPEEQYMQRMMEAQAARAQGVQQTAQPPQAQQAPAPQPQAPAQAPTPGSIEDLKRLAEQAVARGQSKVIVKQPPTVNVDESPNTAGHYDKQNDIWAPAPDTRPAVTHNPTTLRYQYDSRTGQMAPAPTVDTGVSQMGKAPRPDYSPSPMDQGLQKLNQAGKRMFMQSLMDNPNVTEQQRLQLLQQALKSQPVIESSPGKMVIKKPGQ